MLGARLSVAGGPENALHSAVQVGCACVQIFVKNQRQWRAPPLRNEQIERFRAAQGATHVAPVIAHEGYLLNLASPDNRARLGSPSTSQEEVARAIAELEGAPPLRTWGARVGATITVASEPNKGSSFTVTVPSPSDGVAPRT